MHKKVSGSSQYVLNLLHLWNWSWIYFFVGFGFFFFFEEAGGFCANGSFFLKTNSLVLSVLLQAGDSMTSAMKCFRGICIGIQCTTIEIPDENFEA